MQNLLPANLIPSMLALSAAVLLAFQPAGAADKYPSKPIKMIVPYAAGGNMEMWRPTWEELGRALGQSVVVEYKPGAGGSIGTAATAMSPADGYTLVVGTIGTHAINYNMYPDIQYKPEDFVAVSIIGEMPDLVAVNSALPIQSVADLVSQAKANPGKILFGSPGVGSSSHLVGELFNMEANITLGHVPYKGSAPEIMDLLAGNIQVTFDNLPLPLPHVKSGKLRALAVTTADRAPLLPDVPTLAEAGFPNFDVSSWYAVYAPSKTPRAILDKLNAELTKVLRMPKIADQLAAQGWSVRGTSIEEAESFTQREVERWAQLIDTAGIRPQ